MSPIYVWAGLSDVSFVVVTVAWYMIDLTLHLFDRGHLVFLWQLHAVSLSVEDDLDNLDLLCLSIVCLIFGIQL